MSEHPLLFGAMLLVLASLATIGGICVAAAIHAETRAERVMYAALGCITVVAFAITTTLLR